MAITTFVRWKGLERYQNVLKRIEKGGKSAMREFMREYGKRIKVYAKENASKRIYPQTKNSYPLSQSILRRTGVDNVTITASAPYAGTVEMGSEPHFEPNHWWFSINEHPGAGGVNPNYPARGFMRKAIEKVDTQIIEIVNQTIGKIFR